MKITKEQLRKAIADSHDVCEIDQCIFEEAIEALPKTIKRECTEQLQVVLCGLVKTLSEIPDREISVIQMNNCVSISEMWAKSELFRQVIYGIFDDGLHIGYRLRKIQEAEIVEEQYGNKSNDATKSTPQTS